MTSVNVSSDYQTVVVTEADGKSVIVSTPTPVVTVKAIEVGPQGPPGAFNFSDAEKVDKSIIYYDASLSIYKADSTITKETITDGGNF